MSFELRRPDGLELPSFSAGSHIDVHAAEGVVRQYSICNAPRERDRYVIGVLREPMSRGGSSTMHDAVHEGAKLTISEPKNFFKLTPTRRALLLAGGIGITPLLSMAEQLNDEGRDFDLHYCTRSQGRAAFRDYVLASAFSGRTHFYFDDAPAAGALDLPALLKDQDDLDVYICGPTGFIAFAQARAQAAGVPHDRIHIEHFAAPAEAAAGAAGAERAFQLRMARSGKLVEVGAAETIVAAAARVGIEIPVSCEQGVCGTCMTKVVAGVPDHHDYCLSDSERAANDQMTPCCSRSLSDLLVLDL